MVRYESCRQHAGLEDVEQQECGPNGRRAKRAEKQNRQDGVPPDSVFVAEFISAEKARSAEACHQPGHGVFRRQLPTPTIKQRTPDVIVSGRRRYQGLLPWSSTTKPWSWPKEGALA